LERQLATLPHGSGSYEQRIEAAKSQFDEVDKRAVELNVLISSYTAERVAIERYFHDTHQDQDPKVAETFSHLIGEARANASALNQAYSELRKDISDQSLSVGVGDVQTQ